MGTGDGTGTGPGLVLVLLLALLPALVATGGPLLAQPADGGGMEARVWLPLLARHALLGEIKGRIGEPLTAHPTDDWEPATSPDGRWIAYLSRPAGSAAADGRARLRVMAADEGCDRVLVLPPFDDLDLPVWDPTGFVTSDRSPEGRPALLFAGLRSVGGVEAQWDLYRVRLEIPTEAAACPTVRLAAAPGHGLVLAQDEEDTLQNLSATPGLDEGRPALSPDGRWLAFDEAIPGDGDWNIGLIDLSSGARRALTEHPARDRKPSFSPDGRRIVFRSERSGRSQIYRVDREGGGLARLTFTEGASDGYPSYAPDGRHILFESDKGATKGLYLMDAYGRGRQVLLSDDRLRFATPSWDPSGDAILFSAGTPDEALGLRRMRLPALTRR